MKVIQWQGLEDQTIEEFTFRQWGDELHIHSTINGIAEGQPVNLVYQVVLAADWTCKSFVLHAGQQEVLHLTRNSQKEYTASYIDFCLTPFTNTLPISKEKLKIGEKTLIEVLYICYPNLELHVVSQEYERIAERHYRFKHVSTGFEAIIHVDEEDWVTEYTGLFRRIVRWSYLGLQLTCKFKIILVFKSKGAFVAQ